MPKVETEDLLGAAEVAEVLHLAHASSVTTYLKRYGDFPKPIVELPRSKVRLWRRQEIESWRDGR